MCMINIFVVCFLPVSCNRLIQPVKVYINWYMIWYLQNNMFCREHIFFDWCIIFLNSLSIVRFFFGWSGHHSLVWPSSVIQLTCSTWKLFVCSTHVFLRMLVLTIVRAIISVGPGFDPLDLQHNLFVGPGFNFLALIACFRPIASLTYVSHPHKWSNRWHRKQKNIRGKNNLSAWLVALAKWGSRKVSTCGTTA